MPDNDIFKALEAGFRKPYKLLLGGCSPQEVADSCAKSLVKKLKQLDGCPAFEQIVTLIIDYKFGLFSEMSLLELLRQFQQIEALVDSNPITQMAIDEAKSLCNAENHVFLPEDVSKLLAEQIIDRATEYYFSGPSVQSLSGQTFDTWEELEQWTCEFKEALRSQMSKPLEAFVQDPSAQTMSIPRASHLKLTTTQMLNVEIPTL